MTLKNRRTPGGLLVALGCVGILGMSHTAGADQGEVRQAFSKTPGFARLFTADAATPATESAPADTNLAASIDGIVHDPSGEAVAGVTLTITNLATDQIQSRTSDPSGAFIVQNVTPGSYEIRAEKAGFRDANATIVLAASQRAHADVRLKLAGAAENSAVSASTSAPGPDPLETRLEQLEAELAKLKAFTGGAASAQQAPAPTGGTS